MRADGDFQKEFAGLYANGDQRGSHCVDELQVLCNFFWAVLLGIARGHVVEMFNEGLIWYARRQSSEDFLYVLLFGLLAIGLGTLREDIKGLFVEFAQEVTFPGGPRSLCDGRQVGISEYIEHTQDIGV